LSQALSLSTLPPRLAVYRRSPPGAYQKRVVKAEKKLKDFMVEAEEVIDKAGCPTKAIFVTFSTQAERAACENACPKSERARTRRRAAVKGRLETKSPCVCPVAGGSCRSTSSASNQLPC
jgi:hypothetical protein